MSDNKKYYYLKLKDNFFDSDQMIVLESMPDGYKYSNILLKLYLRSLKNDGKLMFNDRIPYNSTILSQVTRHSVGDVEKAVKIFSELDLIEILENGAIYMLDIQNFIGESSTEADRIRAYRARINQEKNKLLGTTNAQSDSVQMYDKSTPDIEIELDKELELDIDTKSKPKTEKELSDNFNAIWKSYPNKKGKPKAFTSYKKAIKDGVTDEQIIQGLNNYLKEIEIKQTDKQYIKHGSTWFNNYGWEDDYITTQSPKPQTNYRRSSNHVEITPSWSKEQTISYHREEVPTEESAAKEQELRQRMKEMGLE